MIYQILKDAFDFVGVINVERYPNYENIKEIEGFKSIFVVGLAYPNKQLPQQPDKLKASMYSYGYDYHDVIKSLFHECMKDYNGKYKALADNHPLNERLCLELTGLAFRGKNNLMINKDYGSFFFIGLLLTEERFNEVIELNTDSCGDCELCIKACPMNALLGGYDVDKCMSGINQTKKPLPDEVIDKNYLLLGCDICQIVCPKNRNIKVAKTTEFYEKPTTYVLINDLFELSNKEFIDKYGKHAYTWRGKTILLRNALTLLLKQRNTMYNDKIKETLKDDKYPDWYKVDAEKILKRLEELE